VVGVIGAERLAEMGGEELQPELKINARNAEKCRVEDTNLLIKPPAKLLFVTADWKKGCQHSLERSGG